MQATQLSENDILDLGEEGCFRILSAPVDGCCAACYRAEPYPDGGTVVFIKEFGSSSNFGMTRDWFIRDTIEEIREAEEQETFGEKMNHERRPATNRLRFRSNLSEKERAEASAAIDAQFFYELANNHEIGRSGDTENGYTNNAYTYPTREARVGDTASTRYLLILTEEGTTLRDLGEHHDRYSFDDNVCMMLQIVSAIEKGVHEQGWLHLDLKPGNLYLSRKLEGDRVYDWSAAHVRILDFGTAVRKRIKTPEETLKFLFYSGSPNFRSMRLRNLEQIIQVYQAAQQELHLLSSSRSFFNCFQSERIEQIKEANAIIRQTEEEILRLANSLSEADDVFSLMLVFYYLLTGKELSEELISEGNAERAFLRNLQDVVSDESEKRKIDPVFMPFLMGMFQKAGILETGRADKESRKRGNDARLYEGNPHALYEDLDKLRGMIRMKGIHPEVILTKSCRLYWEEKQSGILYKPDPTILPALDWSDPKTGKVSEEKDPLTRAALASAGIVVTGQGGSGKSSLLYDAWRQLLMNTGFYSEEETGTKTFSEGGDETAADSGSEKWRKTRLAAHGIQCVPIFIRGSRIDLRDRYPLFSYIRQYYLGTVQLKEDDLRTEILHSMSDGRARYRIFLDGYNEAVSSSFAEEFSSREAARSDVQGDIPLGKRKQGGAAGSGIAALEKDLMDLADTRCVDLIVTTRRIPSGAFWKQMREYKVKALDSGKITTYLRRNLNRNSVQETAPDAAIPFVQSVILSNPMMLTIFASTWNDRAYLGFQTKQRLDNFTCESDLLIAYLEAQTGRYRTDSENVLQTKITLWYLLPLMALYLQEHGRKGTFALSLAKRALYYALTEIKKGVYDDLMDFENGVAGDSSWIPGPGAAGNTEKFLVAAAERETGFLLHIPGGYLWRHEIWRGFFAARGIVLSMLCLKRIDEEPDTRTLRQFDEQWMHWESAPFVRRTVPLVTSDEAGIQTRYIIELMDREKHQLEEADLSGVSDWGSVVGKIERSDIWREFLFDAVYYFDDDKQSMYVLRYAPRTILLYEACADGGEGNLQEKISFADRLCGLAYTMTAAVGEGKKTEEKGEEELAWCDRAIRASERILDEIERSPNYVINEKNKFFIQITRSKLYGNRGAYLQYLSRLRDNKVGKLKALEEAIKSHQAGLDISRSMYENGMEGLEEKERKEVIRRYANGLTSMGSDLYYRGRWFGSTGDLQKSIDHHTEAYELRHKYGIFPELQSDNLRNIAGSKLEMLSERMDIQQIDPAEIREICDLLQKAMDTWRPGGGRSEAYLEMINRLEKIRTTKGLPTECRDWIDAVRRKLTQA